MQAAAIIKLENYAVEQNINTLRNRVNALGIAEPVIQQQGKNQISVDLPGIQDTARAKALIGKVATVRFQLQDTEQDAQAAAKSGIVPFGTTLYYYEGHPVLLKKIRLSYTEPRLRMPRALSMTLALRLRLG